MNILKRDKVLFSELKNLEKKSQKEKEEGLLVVFDKILEQIRRIHLADFKEALGDKNVNDLKIFFDDLVEKLFDEENTKKELPDEKFCPNLMQGPREVNRNYDVRGLVDMYIFKRQETREL